MQLLVILGCNTEPGFSNELSDDFSPVAKKYFMEVAFCDDITIKWSLDTISYSLSDNIPDSNAKFVANTLSYISTLRGLPKFKRVYSADAKISIAITNSMDEFSGSNPHAKNWNGYTSQKVNFWSNKIEKMAIYIRPGDNFLFRRSVEHELLHALGVSGHRVTKIRFSSALGIRYFYDLDPKLMRPFRKWMRML